MKKVVSKNEEYLTLYLDDKDKKPTLKELQKYVGGYIEVVTSADGEKQIIIDEEGKLKGKPINYDATEEYVGEEYDDTNAMWTYDTICGDAVILSGKSRID